MREAVEPTPEATPVRIALLRMRMADLVVALEQARDSAHLCLRHDLSANFSAQRKEAIGHLALLELVQSNWREEDETD